MILRALSGKLGGYLAIGALSAVVILAAGWKLSSMHNDYLSGKLERTEAQLEAAKADVRALSTVMAEKQRLGRERDELSKQLEEAKANAPREVRDCGDVVLPVDLADGLRGDNP